MFSVVISYFLSGIVYFLLGSLDEFGESFSSDYYFCNICLDVLKDCFFDFCGYWCICFICG